jgi:hypothetical protein
MSATDAASASGNPVLVGGGSGLASADPRDSTALISFPIPAANEPTLFGQIVVVLMTTFFFLRAPPPVFVRFLAGRGFF